MKKILSGIIITGILILASIAVSAAMIGGPYSPDADTAALYHLDDGTGTAVHDSSAGGCNGTLSGGNTWVTSARYQGGLQIPVSEPGGFTASLSVPAQNFTVEGWFKPELITGQIYLFGGKGSDGKNIFYVRQQEVPQRGTLLVWGIFDPGSKEWKELTGGSITAGAWYHVAVTAKCSGNDITMCLYQDGVLKNSGIFTFSALPGVITTLKIGRCPWTDSASYFTGVIDEVRVSTVARSGFIAQSGSTQNP